MAGTYHQWDKGAIWARGLITWVTIMLLLWLGATVAQGGELAYPIVDTGQARTFDAQGEIPYPRPGQAFFGQDAQYQGNQPAYRDNGDGTISDLVTGLMWQKTPAGKLTWDQAVAGAAECRTGGHDDWRLPTIKELYSLIDFRGSTGVPARPGDRPNRRVPYLNTDFFDFQYGDPQAGERIIDAQYWSSTRYVSTTMDGNPTAFGVNFADGRIKGYPIALARGGRGRQGRGRLVIYVRGNPEYGRNRFQDNGDGTIIDQATGLTWMRADSGKAMTWSQALVYAEGLEFAGHGDWRLPNAKELQSIVDYGRSPDTTGSAAIDPLFQASPIQNEAGQPDYPFYWTSTTHLDGPRPGRNAVYISFGRALGMMWGQVMDVHGAGAQRSDPKEGRPGLGHGPQGDARRVLNHVRCVRGGAAGLRAEALLEDPDSYPHNVSYPSVDPLARGSGIGVGPGNGRPGMGRGGMPPGGERQGRGPTGMPPGGGSSHQDGRQGLGASQGWRGGMGQGPNDRGRGGQDMGARFVQRLDRDGDGRVSREEFDGPPRHFSLLDRDQDGYLSQDEAPSPPGGGRGQGRW